MVFDLDAQNYLSEFQNPPTPKTSYPTLVGLVGKGEGKRWVVKGEAKDKGGTAVGQEAGDICNSRIGL